MQILANCPSTLASGYDTYCPVALKRLFDTQSVTHILPYKSIERNEEDARLFMQNKKRISISGVQNKYSMTLKGNSLILTKEGNQGRYILKPKPSEIRNPLECAANENLTMQIAEQVFGMETAANGLCFFQEGEPAYLTKRFDIRPDGNKFRVEDFASLAGLTSDNAGIYYKYDAYSYEEVAELVKFFLPAWRVELLKFYRLMLFNFLFSNGDAHLKNFSVIETKDGDFRLSPAYDLLNTRIHVDDTEFALSRGLFKDEGNEYLKGGSKVNGASFRQFGIRIGLPEKVVDQERISFCGKYPQIEALINRSFLSEKTKRQYSMLYQTRRNRLADMKL
ncbi:MAG: HipA domain-containing protein [Candidatus Symbiothrix sp.]|jgi:serine/threonine-protein kinase HipA|nr:HipA domain-containing protein [Candidatus Symbiothrix sp.]